MPKLNQDLGARISLTSRQLWTAERPNLSLALNRFRLDIDRNPPHMLRKMHEALSPHIQKALPSVDYAEIEAGILAHLAQRQKDCPETPLSAYEAILLERLNEALAEDE